MQRFSVLLIVLLCMASPAFSAPVRHRVHPKYSHHKVVKRQALHAHHAISIIQKPINIHTNQLQALAAGVIEQHLQTPIAVGMPTSSTFVATPTIVPQQKPSLPVLAKNPAPPNNEVDYKMRSWVTCINSTQASQIAQNITNYFSTHYPASETTLLLAIPPKRQAHNPFTQALTDDLRKAGFALVDKQSQAPNATIVRYQISKLEKGLWVKIQINQSEINRFYTLGENSFIANSPFSVRQPGGEP